MAFFGNKKYHESSEAKSHRVSLIESLTSLAVSSVPIDVDYDT